MGSDQSGKSSLATKIFKESVKKSFLPIILDAEKIRRTNAIEKYIDKAFQVQYNDLTLIPNKDIVLIIDNFDLCPLNDKAKKNLFFKLDESYNSIILFSNENIRFKNNFQDLFGGYNVYSIQDFGAKKLYEFIHNWVYLECDETVELVEINRRIDFYNRSLKSVLGKNIVPSKPLYISMILQGLISNEQTINLTSHGHCYYILITESLKKSGVHMTEIADYMNYLSELAWFMYERKKSALNKSDISDFKEFYETSYYHSNSEEKLTKIKNAGIISIKELDEDTILNFQYKYCFYYFVSKHIAEEDEKKCQLLIKSLLEDIHLEESSQIIIFILHHTKRQSILDLIIKRCENIFKNETPATLDADELQVFEKFALSLPELAGIGDDDFEDRRLELLNARDVEEKRNLWEKQKNQKESQEPIYDYQYSLENENINDEYIDTQNVELLQLFQSTNAMNILGQIVKQRKGSLKQNQITPLAQECYNVGLRLLKFAITSFARNEQTLIDQVQELLLENEEWSEKECSDQAVKLYMTLCFFISFASLKQISKSVGQKDFGEMYSVISSQMGTTSAKLIEIIIDLEYNKKLPKKLIKDLFSKHKNSMIRRLIQECLIDHVQLNFVDEKDKTWIFKTLEIPKAQLANAKTSFDRQKLETKTPSYQINTQRL